MSTLGLNLTQAAASRQAAIDHRGEAYAKTNGSTKTMNSNPGGASAPTSSSEITGSDFLSLLVSELKNQDPTQPSDPQAYVQQLVGVNSLQQLIQINKDLGGTT